MEAFAKRPFVQMKMILYPQARATLPGEFGVGAHTESLILAGSLSCFRRLGEKVLRSGMREGRMAACSSS